MVRLAAAFGVRCVDGGDVAADADAAFGVEAGFAHAAAALVFEDVDRAVVGGPAEEDVRDELLEAGVFFHVAAGQVLDVVAFDEPGPVAFETSVEKPWK